MEDEHANQQQQQDVNYQERLVGHCELGQYDEIAALLRDRRGLFVNCVNSAGNTPLHAVRDVRCAELLLESGGGLAALNRQNRDGETPLLIALRLGRADLAEYYLDNGADIRARNRHFQHALHVAAHAGLPGLLDRLLAMRQLDPSQPDRMGNAPLHYAVAHPDQDLACDMLSRLLGESQLAVDGADALGRTAFALAAQSGNLTACRMLRDRGADLCRADPNGANALHVAAAVSGVATLRYLVSDLAFSVDRPDRLGRTALFYATHHGAEASIETLLALGADPKRIDKCGRSPVHVAAEKGFESCLGRLLLAGGDSGGPADNRGQTPLHLAAGGGHKALVKRLLQCPPAVKTAHAVDADGKTARDLAQDAGHKEVAQLLARVRRPTKQPPQPPPAAGEAADRQKQQQQQQQQQSYPRPRSAKFTTAKAAAESTGDDRQQERTTDPLATPEKTKPPPVELETVHQAEEDKEKEEKKKKTSPDEITEVCVASSGSSSPSPASPAPAASNKSSSSSSTSLSLTVVGDDKPAKDEQKESSRRRRSSGSSGSSKPASDDQLVESGHYDSRRDDPYLSAHPAWITGAPSAQTQKTQQQQQQPQQQKQRRAWSPSLQMQPQQQQRQQPKLVQQKQRQRQPLRRSQAAAPNIAALRQRLYMYDSTVMLGRLMHEERRERMYLRGGGGGGNLPEPNDDYWQQRKPPHRQPRQRRPVRPSTATEADRLTDRYRNINRETRELLDKWKLDRGVDGGDGSSRLSTERSGSAHRRGDSSSRQQQNQQPPPPPYRRPQSGSRFLDYFPNNRQQQQQQKQQQQRDESPDRLGGGDDNEVGRSSSRRRRRRSRSRRREARRR